jgi:hypothetical protein
VVVYNRDGTSSPRLVEPEKAHMYEYFRRHWSQIGVVGSRAELRA